MYSLAGVSSDMSDMLSVDSSEFLDDTEDVTENQDVTSELVEDPELSLIQLSDSADYDLYELSSYDEQILFELQVTNHLLGVSIALHVFLLALIVFFFFLLVIRNNVTKLFT